MTGELAYAVDRLRSAVRGHEDARGLSNPERRSKQTATLDEAARWGLVVLSLGLAERLGDNDMEA